MREPRIEDYFGYALDNYELFLGTKGEAGFTRRQALAEIMANYRGLPNFHTAEGNTRIRALEDPDLVADIKVIDWLLSDEDEPWKETQ